MAETVLTNCKLFFDEYDLSGDVNAIAINYSADMQENTTFSDDTHVSLGGLKSVTMGHEGYFSAGTDEIDPTLFNNMAVADAVMTVGPTTGADGEIAYTMQSVLSEYSPGGSIGDVFPFSVSAEASSSGLVRGTVMLNATVSSTGDGVARQLGAVSDGQSVYGAIHVTSGSGTLLVIAESDDNSGMTSSTARLTFTSITGKTSEWLSLPGPITDDYWRITYVVSGTFDFVVVLGIQ